MACFRVPTAFDYYSLLERVPGCHFIFFDLWYLHLTPKEVTAVCCDRFRSDILLFTGFWWPFLLLGFLRMSRRGHFDVTTSDLGLLRTAANRCCFYCGFLFFEDSRLPLASLVTAGNFITVGCCCRCYIANFVTGRLMGCWITALRLCSQNVCLLFEGYRRVYYLSG